MLNDIKYKSYFDGWIIGFQHHITPQYPLGPASDTKICAPQVGREVAGSLEEFEGQGTGKVLQTEDEAAMHVVVWDVARLWF